MGSIKIALVDQWKLQEILTNIVVALRIFFDKYCFQCKLWKKFLKIKANKRHINS